MLQPTGLTPVDAELWWCDYLRDELVAREETVAANVFVGRAVPTPRIDRMVIVRRDGGSIIGTLDQPQMTFNVWAATDQDATDLANLVVGLALTAPLAASSPLVRVLHAAGPTSVPDPSGQPRRLVGVDTLHRAAVLAPTPVPEETP